MKTKTKMKMMNVNKAAKWLVLTLTVIMILSLSACGSQNADSSETSGALFSAMKTEDLDGNAADSSVFAENKLTVVNTWNLGCTPCIEEIPALNRLNKEYADKGVAVKGLYYNWGKELSEEDRADIRVIMAKSKADYPHLLISGKMMETKEMKELDSFPTTYFVDSKGRIVGKVLGSNDYAGWTALVDKALKKVEEND